MVGCACNHGPIQATSRGLHLTADTKSSKYVMPDYDRGPTPTAIEDLLQAESLSRQQSLRARHRSCARKTEDVLRNDGERLLGAFSESNYRPVPLADPQHRASLPVGLDQCTMFRTRPTDSRAASSPSQALGFQDVRPSDFACAPHGPQRNVPPTLGPIDLTFRPLTAAGSDGFDSKLIGNNPRHGRRASFAGVTTRESEHKHDVSANSEGFTTNTDSESRPLQASTAPRVVQAYLIEDTSHSDRLAQVVNTAEKASDRQLRMWKGLTDEIPDLSRATRHSRRFLNPSHRSLAASSAAVERPSNRVDMALDAKVPRKRQPLSLTAGRRPQAPRARRSLPVDSTSMLAEAEVSALRKEASSNTTSAHTARRGRPKSVHFADGVNAGRLDQYPLSDTTSEVTNAHDNEKHGPVHKRSSGTEDASEECNDVHAHTQPDQNTPIADIDATSLALGQRQAVKSVVNANSRVQAVSLTMEDDAWDREAGSDEGQQSQMEALGDIDNWSDAVDTEGTESMLLGMPPMSTVWAVGSNASSMAENDVDQNQQADPWARFRGTPEMRPRKHPSSPASPHHISINSELARRRPSVDLLDDLSDAEEVPDDSDSFHPLDQCSSVRVAKHDYALSGSPRMETQADAFGEPTYEMPQNTSSCVTADANVQLDFAELPHSCQQEGAHDSDNESENSSLLESQARGIVRSSGQLSLTADISPGVSSSDVGEKFADAEGDIISDDGYPFRLASLVESSGSGQQAVLEPTQRATMSPSASAKRLRRHSSVAQTKEKTSPALLPLTLPVSRGERLSSGDRLSAVASAISVSPSLSPDGATSFPASPRHRTILLAGSLLGQPSTPYHVDQDDCAGSLKSSSSSSGSGSSRRLFSRSSKRLSDESEPSEGSPSSVAYAQDAYDTFVQKRESPLKPRRNSYLNRLITGEVRETPRSSASNSASSLDLAA